MYFLFYFLLKLNVKINVDYKTVCLFLLRIKLSY